MQCGKRSWAFSIAEVIVALGVFSGVFLVVVALFTQLMRSHQKEADLTAGTLLAEAVLTERLQKIFANLEPGLTKEQFFSEGSPPLSPLEGTVLLNKAVFTYRISHSTITAAGGGEIGGPPARNNRLKKLDVVVWWWGEQATDARGGYGYLRTEATRLVNENASFEV